MNIIWGVILTCLTVLAWLGQVVSAVSPKTGAKFGLTEYEADVDPTLYADIRGEAIWDTLILWTLPVAGILLIFDNFLWPYFGLVGGGMYLYFAGRGIIVRLVMKKRGIRIGSPKTYSTALFFLFIWGLAAVVTIILALIKLI